MGLLTAVKPLALRGRYDLNPFIHANNIETIYIIHFWASWCGPCREEFPSRLRASQKLSNRIRIITVSLDDEVSAAKNFVMGFGLKTKNVFFTFDGKKTTAQVFGTIKLPETYILDHNLLLIRKIGGAMDWENKTNFDYLMKL